MYRALGEVEVAANSAHAIRVFTKSSESYIHWSMNMRIIYVGEVCRARVLGENTFEGLALRKREEGRC